MIADKAHTKTTIQNLMAQTKAILRRFDLRARKSLGQHFLINSEVLANIASAAELTIDDTVIEVGPGLGMLTRELAKRAGSVVAIELDDKLVTVLKKNLVAVNNVTVINADILKIDPAALLSGERDRNLAQKDKSIKYKVVANLPYYIASAVLRHFLEASKKPRLMVVMLQKEVAEAIVAKPGKMNFLSVSIQFYGQPEIISYITAEDFYPPPAVDSAVLKIDVYPQPSMMVDDIGGFFELVRAGFCAPRKQLVNSLTQGMGIGKTEVKSLLNSTGINYRRRAETLSLTDWQLLWQRFRRY
ncbi:MAG: ribosomal RNA small subunit methyltransferase A [Dehalococcoidia bacterium]|nr:MAG: ribosomal RNA small subunit methyltransferase A [Dehalococcoidia bacterium]